MATPRKPSTIDVNGLSVDEILDMDVNSLSKKDLQKVATRLMSAANKRIKRLANSEEGGKSPAYKVIEERGGKFSVKGKSLQALRQEFADMRNFMRYKTSSLSKWRDFKKKKRKELEDRTGQKISKAVEKRFWEVYGKVSELGAGQVATAVGVSEQLQEAVLEQVKDGKSEEDILNAIDQTYEEVYENAQSSFDFSGAFDPNFEG